ncbi:hypothetical protein D3C86_1770710 [compost metagenome]
MLSQAALEIYIQSGMFARRKDKIRDAYSQRLLKLHDSLTVYSQDTYSVAPPLQSGVHTHIELPAAIQLPLLLERLRKKQVLLHNLSSNYLPGFIPQLLLSLSITRVPEERIDAGVRLIANEIKHMLKQGKRN